ncbi:unnamed protein product [Menidia menidia]|uniref:(Atlantic silverside) hypothetical protein n=1 Tax=Menidia menidia TaxID=238744 RepID=A0A8S4AE01_9TELE|nr:unnamed protein product [Menidia menidia]
MRSRKMAPVWEAGHQLLRLLCVFLLFVTHVAHAANTLRVFDRQTLLDLRIYAKDLVNFNYYGQKSPFLSDISTYLCLTPAPPPQRKRHRCRGKRSGCLVRLRAGLLRTDQCIWSGASPLYLSTFPGPCRCLVGTGGGLGCDVAAPRTLLSSPLARSESGEPAASVSGLLVSCSS